MSRAPKLSICIITFNHAQFIAKALDTALMQRVTFDYNIIIGDDCSTDGTDKIIREYQSRWPDKIVPLYHKANVGMGKNVKETLDRCNGEYVAFLEGDDYWTSPEKLQMQVDYLDSNPACALCHHRVDYVAWPGGKVLKEFPPERFRMERPDPHALAMINYIQTCSVVCRRKWLPPVDEALQQLKLYDWPLFVLLSERGGIGYLDRAMADYRIHDNNSWNERPGDYKIRVMEAMARYLLAKVDSGSKTLWMDMILALAFKDLILALQSFALVKSFDKLKRFVVQSAEFKKPFWLLNRLWPYYKANSGK
ncbi:MAG TPA: glycosyltransferase [Verrucomicrobiae bacterium]|nr:glycosyltransferase [Verrucomicrobiae bacterium]